MFKITCLTVCFSNFFKLNKMHYAIVKTIRAYFLMSIKIALKKYESLEIQETFIKIN